MFPAVQVVCLTLALIAADVWTDPYPGIRYLHRSTNEPKEIHALVIDLSRPELSLRATKCMTTARLAELMFELGAHVAINLDGGGSSAMVVGGTRVSSRPRRAPWLVAF